MTRPVRSNPPRARDPYGTGPLGAWLAPVLSIVGLVLVGILTWNLLNGQVPFGIGAGNGGNGGDGGDGGPARTAAPSNIVVVPEEAAFEGSIVYAKGGNIWIQTDDDARQLTDSGKDAMPSWSADGEWVYYINSVREQGRWPVKGVVEDYTLDVPRLMRVKSDGSSEPEALKAGRISSGNRTYSYWIRQPVVSPDGTTVAVISDAPNPDEKTLGLQLYGMETDKITDLGLETNGALGHQDPEWRPDGKTLLYVMNGRDGSRGAPVIMRYTVDSGRTRAMTGFGYLYPSYSRDGRYIAATRTSAFGTDIVILDGGTGEELLRVTDDGQSWAPTWSPAGDGIAFLHIDGQTVDLRLAKLEGAAPGWNVTETIDLTEVSGLEPASRPDWFIPAEDLPPLPTPAPASPAASGSPAASAAP
jgi:Tol biopolymer transport system component